MSQYQPLTKDNVAQVLRRMAEQCEKSPEDAEVYAEDLDVMLEGLLEQDFFGIEGQHDPRGDHRD